MTTFFPLLVFVAALSQVLALDCSKLDLSTLSKSCCKVPPKDLVTSDMVSNCNADKNTLKWINSFMINKMLKADGSLDLKSSKNTATLCKVVDKDFNTYDGKKALETLLKTSRDGTWATDGFSVVEEENALEYITNPFKFNVTCTVKKVTTKHYVGMLFPVQYFLGHLNMVCEEPVATTKCEKMWNNFYECHGQFESSAYAENKAVYKLGEPIREKLRKKGKPIKKLYF